MSPAVDQTLSHHLRSGAHQPVGSPGRTESCCVQGRVRFDAVLYYDTTRAVKRLERTGLWERGDPPETFPSTL